VADFFFLIILLDIRLREGLLSLRHRVVVYNISISLLLSMLRSGLQSILWRIFNQLIRCLRLSFLSMLLLILLVITLNKFLSALNLRAVSHLMLSIAKVAVTIERD
jgi:hypothetical protein